MQVKDPFFGLVEVLCKGGQLVVPQSPVVREDLHRAEKASFSEQLLQEARSQLFAFGVLVQKAVVPHVRRQLPQEGR